jgi:hypothetical protein
LPIGRVRRLESEVIADCGRNIQPSPSSDLALAVHFGTRIGNDPCEMGRNLPIARSKCDFPFVNLASSKVRRTKTSFLDTSFGSFLLFPAGSVVNRERAVRAAEVRRRILLMQTTPASDYFASPPFERVRRRRRPCPARIPRSTAAPHSSDGGASLYSSCQFHHSYVGV